MIARTHDRVIFPCRLTVLLLVLLAGCARNPVTGDREIALISEGQEISYGKEAHPEILAQFGAVEDQQLQNYMQRVGNDLAKISHRPELPWTFTVVDVPVVNAFALPGGYIYFTRGILAHMNSEAELAGVMGHEIGHVTARHAVSQMSRAQLFSLGLGLGSIFSPTFRNLSDIAQLGVGLLFLKYGREDEEQSDELGVEYMFKAGYDPREMSNFFQVFQSMQEESGQAVPNWLSSHPAPPDRIEATAQLASKYLASADASSLRVNRQEHLTRLEGLVFGENPREGFTSNGIFFHPELRFQIDYPDGWNVQNSKSAVIFVEPNGNAAIQLTLAPQGGSPEARAVNLGRQQGVQMVDGRRLQIDNNSAYLAAYQIRQANNQSIQAIAAFISYNDNLYQLVGMAPSNAYRSYSSTLQQGVTNFRRVTDSSILNVTPDRIRIVRAEGGETLKQISSRYSNSRVSLEDLALLNRIEPGQRLESGTMVKVVEPGQR